MVAGVIVLLLDSVLLQCGWALYPALFKCTTRCHSFQQNRLIHFLAKHSRVYVAILKCLFLLQRDTVAWLDRMLYMAPHSTASLVKRQPPPSGNWCQQVRLGGRLHPGYLASRFVVHRSGSGDTCRYGNVL